MEKEHPSTEVHMHKQEFLDTGNYFQEILFTWLLLFLKCCQVNELRTWMRKSKGQGISSCSVHDDQRGVITKLIKETNEIVAANTLTSHVHRKVLTRCYS